MPAASYVTLVPVGGTPVRLADQKGAPFPTTGTGALVFANAPVLNNPVINGFSFTGDFNVAGDIIVTGDIQFGGTLIGSIPTPMITEGDLYYYGPTGPTRLARGTPDQVLSSGVSGLNWVTPIGGGSVTSVSVLSLNGFSGNVANPTTTPTITIQTTLPVGAIPVSNGTGLQAAPLTGTGNVVLANSPTLITPNIGVANGTSLVLAQGLVVGYAGVPQDDTIQLGDDNFGLDFGAGVIPFVEFDISDALSYARGTNTFNFLVSSSPVFIVSNNSITPGTDGTSSLGTTGIGWQNLHGNTGFTLNIENGNWLATHTSGVLTVGTGDLRVTTAGTNSASVVTVGGTQTLTGKTLNSPTLVTPNIGAATGTTLVLTSSSASALAVGLNGATNPAFRVNASTASQISGFEVIGFGAGESVQLNAISSEANASLQFNAKGSGTIGIGTLSTGSIFLNRATVANLGITASTYAVNSSNLNNQVGTSYSLVAADNGKVVTLNNAAAVTVTLPSGLTAGFSCTLIQLGAGQVTLAASGTTLNNSNGLKTRVQHSAMSVIWTATNVYNISGDTTV
jgi:hypothetical protein